MATTTGTHVNFVKVPTKAKFDDITTKADGTVYFIVDEKKIHLDGVMYGFNDSDIDLTPFFRHDGTVPMTGHLYMEDGWGIVGTGGISRSTGGNDTISVGLDNPGNNGHVRILLSDDLIDGNMVEAIFSQAGLEFKSLGEKAIIKGLGVINHGDTEFENIRSDHALAVGTLKNWKGAPRGFAELNSDGVVPSEQLPSYVDDVVEYSDKASFPASGEAEKGKLYIDLSNNRVYRWGGSAYVNVSDGNAHLTIGTTSSTAHRGDHGKEAHDHISKTNNPHAVTKSQVNLGSVMNYGIASAAEAKAGSSSVKYMTPERTKEAITELAPRLAWTVVA